MATDQEPEEQTFRVDFMDLRPQLDSDAIAAQLREAENVLSSYSEAKDFLAEALQNAADAIDTQRRRGSRTNARIAIQFDRNQRTITVTDTGTGIAPDDLKLVLSPNVSLKSGRRARTGTGRSRGHKGVGLTFLALAADHLLIRTCDGTKRTDLVVNGGYSWVTSGGTTPKPIAEGIYRKPDQLLGSPTYTQVHIAQLDTSDFDDDIFDKTVEDLTWLLRTKTAVGNTLSLFSESGTVPKRHRIDVTLRYTDVDGETSESPVEYSYASPAELIPADRIIDFDDVAELELEEIVARVRGQALRYIAEYETASGRQIKMYMIAIDGRDMQEIFEARTKSGEYVPIGWQGFWVAVRTMPAAVSFQPNIIQPRTYERRMFMLLEDDELRLDIGRKSLAGPTARMMREVISTAWKEDLRRVVTRMTRAPGTVDVGTFTALVAAANEKPDLDWNLPYQKVPGEAAGVLAVFHELLGRGNGYLPGITALKTGVLARETDSILIDTDGEPRHVLFSSSVVQLINQLEEDAEDEDAVRTVNLVVLWDLDAKQLRRLRIDAEPVSPGPDGATHELRLAGLGGLQSVRVVVLRTLLNGTHD